MCLEPNSFNSDIPKERQKGVGWKVCRVKEQPPSFTEWAPTEFLPYWKYFDLSGSGGTNEADRGVRAVKVVYKIGREYKVKTEHWTGESISCTYRAGVHLYKDERSARFENDSRRQQGTPTVVVKFSYSQAYAEDKGTIVAKRVTPLEMVG